MKKVVFAIALFFGVQTFATGGVIGVTGFGRVEHDVDFFRATSIVKSQCYKSPTTARDANAILVNEIEAVMRSLLANNGKDRVYNSQGATYRETISKPNPAYVLGTTQPPYIVVCENGWSVQSSVTAEIADLRIWPEFQENVLSLIEKSGVATNIATTSGNLSSPDGMIYEETKKKMRMDALKRAAADASDQIVELSSACAFKITAFLGTEATESNLSGLEKYADASGGFINLSFAPAIQESIVRFRYKISGGGICIANSFADLIINP